MKPCKHCGITQTPNGRLCNWCCVWKHRHGTYPSEYRIQQRADHMYADLWARIGGSDKSQSIQWGAVIVIDPAELANTY